MGLKREHTRYIIKLPVEICSGENTIRGITVRASRKGLFVRSQKSFRVGTPVEMILHITDEISSCLQGVVKHTRNIVELKRQNGMGIEFTAIDQAYLKVISSVEQEKA